MRFPVFIFPSWCNCLSSQEHPHSLGCLTAQPRVGSALSVAPGLVFTESRRSRLINMCFTLVYRRHWRIPPSSEFVLTPAYW